MESSKNLDTKKMLIFFMIFQLFSIENITAQCDEVEQVQPTIMVVPLVNVGGDILNKIENDRNYRIAISEVKNAFIQRGFKTKDFVTAYETLLRDEMGLFDKYTAEEIVNSIIENSTADIIIKAELATGTGVIGHYVEVMLTANDRYSSDNLSELPLSKSQQSRAKNFSELTIEALNSGEGGIDIFLRVMNSNLGSIREKGRNVSVRVKVGENAEINLSEEIDNDYNFLSDLIIEWVESNAYKNYYHIDGETETLLSFDEIRISLRDDNCLNNNPNKFSRKMRTAIYKILRQNKNISIHKLTTTIVGSRITYIIEKK